MDKQEVRDFIDEMIDVLREDGWCQGRSVDVAGRRCLIGARDEVASRGFQAVALVTYEAMLLTAEKQGHYCISGLNDETFTCEDDAVRFLKDAKESL